MPGTKLGTGNAKMHKTRHLTALKGSLAGKTVVCVNKEQVYDDRRELLHKRQEKHEGTLSVPLYFFICAINS